MAAAGYIVVDGLTKSNLAKLDDLYDDANV